MIIPIYIPRINPNKQHKQGQDVDNDPDGLLIGQLSIWSAFRRHFCPWRASCPVAFQRQPLLLFLHWKAYT
jgi:hypothetical protein